MSVAYLWKEKKTKILRFSATKHAIHTISKQADTSAQTWHFHHSEFSVSFSLMSYSSFCLPIQYSTEAITLLHIVVSQTTLPVVQPSVCIVQQTVCIYTNVQASLLRVHTAHVNVLVHAAISDIKHYWASHHPSNTPYSAIKLTFST